MSEQDRTEQELAEQRRAWLKKLAEPGSNYAYGYLDSLVESYLAGGGIVTKQYLREHFLQLRVDMKMARESGGAE